MNELAFLFFAPTGRQTSEAVERARARPELTVATTSHPTGTTVQITFPSIAPHGTAAQLAIAREWFDALGALVGIGGQLPLDEVDHIARADTLDVWWNRGALLVDGAHVSLARALLSLTSQVHWVERESPTGTCFLWRGWFGEEDAGPAAGLCPLYPEYAAVDPEPGAIDRLTIAGFRERMNLSQAAEATSRFLAHLKPGEISLQDNVEGRSRELSTAVWINTWRQQLRALGIVRGGGALTMDDPLLSLRLPELLQPQHFIKLSLASIGAVLLATPHGPVRLIWPHETYPASAYLQFPLGQDDPDYRGAAWQWPLVEAFARAFAVDWCGGGVGLGGHWKRGDLERVANSSESPFLLRQARERGAVEVLRRDPSWFG